MLRCVPLMRNWPAGKKGLLDLIHYTQPKKMIEIGCWAGESTEIFAQNVAEIWAIDPWERMPLIEKSFDGRMRRYPNVHKVKAKSSEVVSIFQKNEFDLVYIDGNHAFRAVCNDILNYYPLVRLRGYITGHDWQLFSVQYAVFETLGLPDMTFRDFSWLVKKHQSIVSMNHIL